MTAADSPSAISVFRLSQLEHARQAPSLHLIRLLEKLESETFRHRLTMHSPLPPNPLQPSLPPAALAALDQVQLTPPPVAKPTPKPRPTSSDLAARVKALRDHLGVTRPKLAVMMGVCRQYITKVENGARASQPFIKLVERMEGEMNRSKSAPTSPPPPKPLPAPPSLQNASARIAVIPLLSQRDTLLLASPKNAAKFAREHFPFSITDPGAFAIRIAGDAMQPLHTDGEIAVAYPDTAPRTGDRVIVRIHDDIGGEVLFRILSGASVGNQVTLSSPNPVYPPLVLDRSQIQWMCPVAATIRQLLS
jgi:transcriptional regulator with XRE-family HTH domain